jgi:hypothetical protein
MTYVPPQVLATVDTHAVLTDAFGGSGSKN